MEKDGARMTLKELAASRRFCNCDPSEVTYETEFDYNAGRWVKFIRHCNMHGSIDLVQHYKFFTPKEV